MSAIAQQPASEEGKLPTWKRFWIYQGERFPLAALAFRGGGLYFLPALLSPAAHRR